MPSLWQRYMTFEGRASRREFWLFTLGAGALEVVLWWLLPPLGSLATLLLALPSLAVTVRRLHDRNRRGWWLLPVPLLVVPFVVLLAMTQVTLLGSDAKVVMTGLGGLLLAMVGYQGVLVVWLAQPGSPGLNRYGPAVDGRP